MKLGAEQLEKNWDELQDLITNTFEGDRLINIRALHEHFEERMTLAPASGRAWFHNAFPGGYVSHVLNVIQWAKSYYELFNKPPTKWICNFYSRSYFCCWRSIHSNDYIN